mmetsp:Transcript_23767/g.54902  ORF Transcript_23767/g.54902 Transcript_23767/m.54902 type:complete len:200 (-) Transcript_23767:2824-3423(-)
MELRCKWIVPWAMFRSQAQHRVGWSARSAGGSWDWSVVQPLAATTSCRLTRACTRCSRNLCQMAWAPSSPCHVHLGICQPWLACNGLNCFDVCRTSEFMKKCTCGVGLHLVVGRSLRDLLAMHTTVRRPTSTWKTCLASMMHTLMSLQLVVRLDTVARVALARRLSIAERSNGCDKIGSFVNLCLVVLLSLLKMQIHTG